MCCEASQNYDFYCVAKATSYCAACGTTWGLLSDRGEGSTLSNAFARVPRIVEEWNVEFRGFSLAATLGLASETDD